MMIQAQCPLIAALLPKASSRTTPQLKFVMSTFPRNASVLSERIATATVRIVFAKTSGNTLGKMCFLRMERLLAPDAFARSTWRDLAQAHQLDAELMRLQAVERASRAADDAGLAPRARDVRLAQDEIARNHGFRSWARLLDSPGGRQFASQIASARERLARAKLMRDAWFRASSIPGGQDDTHRPVKDAWERMRVFLGRHLKKA